MKQFIALLISTGILSFLLPWWIIVPVSFVIAYLLESNGLKSFLISFTTVFLTWSAYAYYLNMLNESILANRVSNLILQTESPVLLIVITGFIGGLISGLAGLLTCRSGFICCNSLSFRSEPTPVFL